MENIELEAKLRILEEEGVDISDPSIVNEYDFDQAELEIVIEQVVAEKAAEVERLRKEDILSRIKALKDANYAHAVLRPEIPNAALFRKQKIIENEDHIEAEVLLQELEAKDAEIQAAIDAVAYIEKRKAEYPSIEECIHAILDGNLEEVQARRASVKAKYPKPE